MSTTDLVADLAKKSGLVWVTYAGRDHAVWHEWVGDAVCVVSGGAEQSLPGIAEQRAVTISLRSKSTRALAARVEARVEVVAPGSEHWETVTSALRAGRLNLADSATAVERWAAESVVVRLVPDAPASTPAAISDDIGHTSPRLAR
ncbi:hypothetical protein [Aeromicrobium endophyticum]|uniref:Pyridoxamine 5'-phosphate oxidase family protein n=1 Tax=Aeromicrobium endophyticum TaxID=2292704 RepID=A0A371P4J6_9ACTN|nr:hypothetical protein [Aeromicrobium endophyticum]REK70825.1 hypothetical protein DX116_17205 [Aeromicrobium endophyticum]